MAKSIQRGGKITFTTFLVLAAILAILLAVYLFMRKKEGFTSDSLVVRYYYLPTCGWCKKFQPEWETFKKNLEEDAKLKPELKNVKTEEIDGSQKKVPVEGFPTVHLVKNGKVHEYSGERTATSLMEEVLKLTK